MEKKYQVFVSSTYTDLVHEREAVTKAILELGCIPSGMELFPAANDEQWELIKRVIDECDYYLVIVAGRYGSCAPNGIGYTEMEYRYALERKKPVIGFVHADPMSLAASRCERTAKGRAALEKFQKLVMSKIVKKWRTPDELGSHVKSSLIDSIKNHPAEGWIRASVSVVNGSPKARDFFSRDDYPSDLNVLLERSSTAVFWGAAFIRFVQHMRERIERRVIQGASIKFLMMEPDGAALGMLNLRGKPEDVSSRRTDLKRNIEILDAIARKTAVGKLEVRVLDYLAPYTLVAYDPQLPTGRLFVWLGSIGVPNSDRPMFSLTRSGDPDWFEFFLNQFELTWNLGQRARAFS